MLIRFSVENFMSFKQQQVFSMAAGKGSRHPSHVVLANNNRLLKSSFIFGANAAGKSNFIHAVDFMRRIVISGDAKRGTSRDKYFRIDPECSKMPGVFQIELSVNEHFYSYGFSYDYISKAFQAEWLYDITTEKEFCLFERDIENKETKTDLDLSKNSIDKMRYEVYKSDISADRLLLTEFAKKEIDESSVFSSFKDVYAWFLKIIVIYPNSRAGNINEIFVNDSGDNTLLAQLLSDFDTGIESISSKKTPLEESLSFLSKDSREQVISAVDKTIHDNADLQSSLENGSRKTFGIENRRFVLSLENGNLMAEELMMNHGNASDLFDLRDESDGTQRLFDLIPAYEVVKDGRVVLIDEIDRSFHSKLTEAYVRKFFELTEGNACQMICTTHDLNLLTLNLLRQDEIWFAERTAEHSTQLYSLSEFKTRSDKSILNDYVQGRYGAVPCILENDHEEG